jgi:SAM-dependent methyltransferase
VIRALAKGALLAGFGVTKTTAEWYRTITREWMGSQATHVDKLQRVWPGYVEVWRNYGVELDGATTWVHEGGWTPFPFLANHLVTGSAGIVTNHEGRMLDRYLARAVNGALACDLPADLPLDKRRHDLEPLRWADTVEDAVAQLGGRLHEGIDPAVVPLDVESVDICHSGGTLEHYRPAELEAFLAEARRVLKPGGTMSHVFDHRDHLHHADARWPFLRHYRMTDLSYRIFCGNPLLYHNRLLPGEIAGMFEAAGFERVAIRRMMLPSRRYVEDGTNMSNGRFGIARSQLARRFAAATDDDLRTAAAHYLYRRPGR